MLEDLFKKLAQTPNKAGEELLKILESRRQQYEKYPEELVLIKVFKEFLQKHDESSKNQNVPLNQIQNLSSSEFARVAKIIYDDNVYRDMNDRFVNETSYIRRPVTSMVKKARGMYWEKFHYDQDKESTWRVALNVLPKKELLEKVDTFAQKYHCSWKYVNTVEEYNKRTDPIIIYFPQETEKDKDVIINEVSQFIKPYVRKDKYNIFGYQNMENGIFYAQLPTAKRLKNDLLNCFGSIAREEIASAQTFDELQDTAQKNTRPDTMQHYLVSRILSGKEFSGGNLAIHEWLIDTYKETDKSVCIHCQDGTELHKNDILVWKNEGNKRLWHRVYRCGYQQFTERSNYTNGTWQTVKKNLLTSAER